MSPIAQDDRGSAPSASSFELVASCPGQPALKATLPASQLDTSNEFTKRGESIHKARETGDPSDLSEEDYEIYQTGMKNEVGILRDWCRLHNIEDYREEREKRLWLHWPDTMDEAVSGRLDVHYVSGSHVLIVEWKALWSPHLAPSETNFQGMVQAVLAANEYEGVEHVRVAFNKAMFAKSDIVDYGPDNLARCREIVLNRAWAALQPGAQRIPGNWCLYCPCKKVCPEAGSYSLLPSVITNPQAVVSTMSLEDRALLHKKSLVVRKILDSVKESLKSETDEALESVGLRRTQGRQLDPITDTAGAYNEVMKFVTTPQMSQFQIDDIMMKLWKCMDLAKGRLSKFLCEITGLKKKQAEAKMKELLAEYIEEKRSEGSIEEV